MHEHTCRQNTHIHKIKEININNNKNKTTKELKKEKIQLYVLLLTTAVVHKNDTQKHFTGKLEEYP